MTLIIMFEDIKRLVPTSFHIFHQLLILDRAEKTRNTVSTFKKGCYSWVVLGFFNLLIFAFTLSFSLCYWCRLLCVLIDFKLLRCLILLCSVFFLTCFPDLVISFCGYSSAYFHKCVLEQPSCKNFDLLFSW